MVLSVSIKCTKCNPIFIAIRRCEICFFLLLHLFHFYLLYYFIMYLFIIAFIIICYSSFKGSAKTMDDIECKYSGKD